MNHRWITLAKVAGPFVVLAAAALLALQLSAMRPQPERRPADLQAPFVRVTTVERTDRRVIVDSQGTVSPRTVSQLAPEVSGRIVWVAPSFVPGGFFEEGEPLLRIDPSDYEQAIVRARADLAAARLRLSQEEAEAEIARREWQELGRGDPDPLTIRVPQLENARMAVAAAEANLRRAERDRERTEVRAPYAGRVRSKNADVGQMALAGTPVATIYAIDYAEVRLPLPDDELAFLDLPLAYRGASTGGGPPVTLWAEFAGNRWEWRGRIVRTEGEIDPTTRMVHVVAQVEDPYRRGADPRRPPLSAGMFVHARIEGRLLRDVFPLPRAALRSDGTVLLVDRDNRLHFRAVEIARASHDEILVASGLEQGERVCLTPLDVVTEGMRVRVLPEGPPVGETVGGGPQAAARATTGDGPEV